MKSADASHDDQTAKDSGVGLTTGASIGGVVGAVLGNFGVGLIVGAMLGIVFGPALGLAMRQSNDLPTRSQ
jgi:outer membrane lipoprotein SlyB